MTSASDAPVASDETVALLAAARQESDELRAELEETNRGVVALYAELDAQADQLKRATELKSRFLAYMSHEFRTPVNAIRSIARLLSDRVDGPLTEEQAKQVDFIQSMATEFARLNSGWRPFSDAFSELVVIVGAAPGRSVCVLVSAEPRAMLGRSRASA